MELDNSRKGLAPGTHSVINQSYQLFLWSSPWLNNTPYMEFQNINILFNLMEDTKARFIWLSTGKPWENDSSWGGSFSPSFFSVLDHLSLTKEKKKTDVGIMHNITWGIYKALKGEITLIIDQSQLLFGPSLYGYYLESSQDLITGEKA